ncbi:putative Lissencephaly-1 [Paratrimastix pyriformis]|uniref:Lissencephaly-1 n=1 Tax=Paratrimastix pyriformis TaxID=342808 RepID=A0ABQ8U7I3_9EUKA|nr:putative Lissencephaly-1 [Paratrimastix pyriformis]
MAKHFLIEPAAAVAAMLLSEKQKQDLNSAILDYLSNNNYVKSFASFQEEAGAHLVPPTDGMTNILEKKWGLVVRLQRKLMEQEEKVASLEEEIKLLSSGNISRKVGKGDALPTQLAKFTLNGHRQPVTSVAFHPKFSVLATAAEDATIKIWDTEGGEIESTLKGHTDVVQCVAWHPQGTILASCSSDLSIKLWDFSSVAAVTLHKLLHPQAPPGAPISHYIASGSRDRTVRIWEVSSGHCAFVVEHENWVRGVVFHPNGRFLLSVSDDRSAIPPSHLAPEHIPRTTTHAISATHIPFYRRTLRAWDLSQAGAPSQLGAPIPSLRCARSAEAHQHFVSCVAQSSQGHQVATGSVDLSVKIWECR